MNCYLYPEDVSNKGLLEHNFGSELPKAKEVGGEVKHISLEIEAQM